MAAPRTDIEVTHEELHVLEDAVKKHKDTTKRAQRSLQVVNEAKELGAATLATLQEQEEQMHRIKTELDDVNEGVEEARGLLAWFGMCCCARCCGCNPPELKKQMAKKKAKQQLPDTVPDIKIDINKVNKGPSEVEMESMDYDQNFEDNTSVATFASKGRRKNRQARGPRGDLIGGTMGQQINEHTQQQNEYLDQIGDGLTDLKVIAKQIGTTVQEQEKIVDGVIEHTDQVSEGVQGLNEHKVLRKFR
eukprot:TRINITY_DN4126_c0_g1_i1.p2 TRINITY_DN4126_c0_g1~~TRINITY_DN4126_c0_g1_i1.p2  ORF type:complete len:264 (-),score=37.33 TRINITY_DN4126_c0_g1_i1:734-1477(-)